MARRKTTTITLLEGDLDPGIRGGFKRVCWVEDKRMGELLSEVMEKKIREAFGPAADDIIEEEKRYSSHSTDRHLDKN